MTAQSGHTPFVHRLPSRPVLHPLVVQYAVASVMPSEQILTVIAIYQVLSVCPLVAVPTATPRYTHFLWRCHLPVRG